MHWETTTHDSPDCGTCSIAVVRNQSTPLLRHATSTCYNVNAVQIVVVMQHLGNHGRKIMLYKFGTDLFIFPFEFCWARACRPFKYGNFSFTRRETQKESLNKPHPARVLSLVEASVYIAMWKILQSPAVKTYFNHHLSNFILPYSITFILLHYFFV